MKILHAGLIAAIALLGAASLATPALARGGHVSIGIGLGFPIYPAYGYGGYGGYYDPYYRPYYAPPPVVYAAPPVVYQEPVQAVPTSPIYRGRDGQYCREYQSTVRVDGRYENSYGTACQEPDGSWHIAD